MSSNEQDMITSAICGEAIVGQAICGTRGEITSKLYQHLETTFFKSLPLWVEKESPILKGIGDSLTQCIYQLVDTHIKYSDFLESNIAKAYKQEDYKIYETFDIEKQFSNKFRNLFRRGSPEGESEILRLLIADITKLFYGTELYEDTDLGKDVTFEIVKSGDVVSGWIAGVTYPSINKVSLNTQSNVPNGNEYVFSQKDFLLLRASNKSSLNNTELENFLRGYFLPFSIPTIFTFIK